MSVELVLEGVRRGTLEGLRSARERLSVWRDDGVRDTDKAAFDILVEMVDEFLSRGSAIGTPCQMCRPDGAPGGAPESEMGPLCIACVSRLRDICASRGGMVLSHFGDGSIRFEMHGLGAGSFCEWAYHATYPDWMPTIARIGIVPRRQPASHSSEQRGASRAAVFFCKTADDAAAWNGTILRFSWPEMWGRDPYGEGHNCWTDRWIPPELLEVETDGKWVPVRSAG